MDARIKRILGRVKPRNLDLFKKWIHMPKVIATHPEFSADNALEWVPREAYGEYIRYMIGRSTQYKNIDDSSNSQVESLDPATPPKSHKHIKISSHESSNSEGDVKAPRYIEIYSDESEASPAKVLKESTHISAADSTSKAITYIEISSDESEASPQRNYPPSAIRINRAGKNGDLGKRKYIEISSDDSEGEVEVVRVVKMTKTIT
ncbi:hypothetical protein H0H93_008177 [Arthromyces matolae]|nr:hypothetical protein H0H93_008177 [Arthromyces matolae]